MSIAKKIGLLILLAVVGLLGLGGFSLLQLSRTNELVRDTNERGIPHLLAVADARGEFLQARGLVLTAIVETDPARRKALHEQFQKHIQAVNEALERYQLGETDAAALDQLEKSRQIFKRYQEAFTQRAFAALLDNRSDEAMGIWRSAAPVVAELTAGLFAQVELTKKQLDHSAQEAQASYQLALGLVIAAIVIVGALVAVVGLFTYRHVTGGLSHLVRTFDEVAERLDFTRRLAVKGDDELAKVSHAFDDLLARLQESLRQINARAESVSGAAQRVSVSAEQMATASDQQSMGASSMAAAVEEMTVSVNHVADRAEDTRRLAGQAAELARQGQGVIKDTVSAINSIAATVESTSAQVRELEEHSGRISSVVQVIKDVADQTNLLALNAAIEAARAGEQGRGFAVVADEVRKLAERTAQSTQEITETIGLMVKGARAAVDRMASVEGAVAEGVEHAGEASTAMIQISSGSDETISMVGDISDAIREQGVASTDIAQQVEKMAQMAEENSAAAQSAASISIEMAGLAEELHDIVARYRV